MNWLRTHAYLEPLQGKNMTCLTGVISGFEPEY